ncbi:hypothetical protein C2845_PM10G21490 [Panicum miliaceum]|uniref:Uncharacterized protein n=1 Tax=Panicum miliaceum TaxID=4540 RepID=A0A3L6PBU7_PANMI|nr:hypothetical protein C2845_PM10G21490 [Panicum miliaceum]
MRLFFSTDGLPPPPAISESKQRRKSRCPRLSPVHIPMFHGAGGAGAAPSHLQAEYGRLGAQNDLNLEAVASLVLRAARQGDAPATPALPYSRQDITMAASPTYFGGGDDAAVAKDPWRRTLDAPSTFPFAAMYPFDPGAEDTCLRIQGVRLYASTAAITA